MFRKSKFSLFDAVLAMVCIVLVTEACAPTAAIGNSQYFWWIFLLIFFFIPYGLVSCELGTTYRSERGIYDWVKRAFGKKWANRVSYYYWVNFPIWIASITVLFISIIELMLDVNIPLRLKIVIEVLFISLVSVLGESRLSKHKKLIDYGTIIKVILMGSLGLIGIYFAITKGSATSFSLSSFFPKLTFNDLSYVSVIIFNFIGLEIIATFRKQVDHPKKDFPKIVFYSGILIAAFYMLTSFGLSVAIPKENLSLDTGLIESFQILLGLGNNNIFIIIISVLFIFTLFVSLLSWTEGVNIECCAAADEGGLPLIFGAKDKKGNLIGSSFITWLTSLLIVLTEVFISEKDLFWSFFALNLITLLLTYLPMFVAFKKLREKDKFAIRPYKVPGNKLVINLITYIPTILLILSIIFTMMPSEFTYNAFIDKMPIIIGTIISIIVGEVLIIERKPKKKWLFFLKKD